MAFDNLLVFLIAVAIALGAAGTSAVASEAFSGAKALDRVEVRHNLKYR